MDEKQTKRGCGAVVVMSLVAVLVLLPALYVLSIGPVVWLVNSGFISESLIPAIERIYWPLRLLAVNVPIVGPAIEQYANWWRPTNPAFAMPSGS